jgi:hypothetical protein
MIKLIHSHVLQVILPHKKYIYCRLTGYWVSTPEGVQPKVSNQGSSINYLLIATLSLYAKREGSYVRRASSVQAILNCSCAVN